MDLAKHLAQLCTLDEHSANNDSWINELIQDQDTGFEDTESLDYKHFLEDAYELKKQLIMRPLGF